MDVKPATWAEFKGDLRASLRAWRVAPLLPLTSVALTSMTYIPEHWWWVGLPALLFAFGWPGTERIWYLRIFRDEAISFRELWRMTWAFVARFVRLGLIAAVAWSPVLVVAVRSFADDPENADFALETPGLWVGTIAATVVIDFALTFVTPALAFTTRSVRDALRIGFRMLRDHWPRTAWYAAIPPLAVVLMLRVTESSAFGLPGALALTAAGTLLNVWFKGATAAFYLRRVQVGSEGAAFLPKTQALEAPPSARRRPAPRDQSGRVQF
ncbi:MAG: hypothetical protein M3134_06040 [Actinomycetota bacterium]|nr:hypothetical protein [Actinomycetota bacterium]